MESDRYLTSCFIERRGAEAVQDGRIHFERINGPFLFKEGGTPEDYGAGLGGVDTYRIHKMIAARVTTAR